MPDQSDRSPDANIIREAIEVIRRRRRKATITGDALMRALGRFADRIQAEDELAYLTGCSAN